MSVPARLLAVQILARVRAGSSLSAALPNLLPKSSVDQKALVQALCYGVLRCYIRLQAITQQLLAKPLKAKDQDIELLIFLGLYQLKYLRIPAHAAVNETVAVVDKLKKPWARGLVNAVLRQYLKQADTLETQLMLDPVYANMHPAWLLQQLKQAWPTQWQAICETNNQQPPMGLRVNVSKNSRADYLQQLENAGIDAAPMQYSDTGIYLTTPQNVEQLPGFDAGCVSVQDEAAQLAAPLLKVENHHHVLDACSAPGGKAAHILEISQIKQLIAVEKEADRVLRLNNTFDRLQLSKRVTVHTADVIAFAANYQGVLFDRILLDVPCSATGVIRRHPDIKLHRTKADITALAKTQLDLLRALWPLLAAQGRLLYCTCSILPAENNEVITAFITNQADATVIDINASWGIAQPIGRQILPGMDDNMDGFYYAYLQKN